MNTEITLNPSSAHINVADTNSLRQFLIAGMKDVMQGQITTWQAKAACNFAQQIYNVTALEVKVMSAQEKLNGRELKTVPFGISDSSVPADVAASDAPPGCGKASCPQNTRKIIGGGWCQPYKPSSLLIFL